jgi:hypothetical protein
MARSEKESYHVTVHLAGACILCSLTNLRWCWLISPWNKEASFATAEWPLFFGLSLKRASPWSQVMHFSKGPPEHPPLFPFQRIIIQSNILPVSIYADWVFYLVGVRTLPHARRRSILDMLNNSLLICSVHTFAVRLRQRLTNWTMHDPECPHVWARYSNWWCRDLATPLSRVRAETRVLTNL